MKVSFREPFQVSTCCHGTPALEFQHAPKALHSLLKGIVLCNLMTEAAYQTSQAAGAFVQGGANLNEGWILIEFWKPAGAQAFVDFAKSEWNKINVQTCITICQDCKTVLTDSSGRIHPAIFAVRGTTKLRKPSEYKTYAWCEKCFAKP